MKKRRRGRRNLRKKRRGPPPLLSRSAPRPSGRATPSRCRRRTASPTPTSWREWRRKSTPGRQELKSCLSGGPGRKKSFWSSKRGETFRPSAKNSTARSGRGLSKLGTSTRPLKKKRMCLPCAWHWADQHLTGLPGSSPALVGWRLQWSGWLRQTPRVCFS